MAKSYGVWFTAMFAADAHFEARLNASPALRAHSYQLPYAFAVKHLKRVIGQYFIVHIMAQETARIIPAEAKGGLG